MADDAATIAKAYFAAWKSKDFTTFRSLLADDVEFVGPLAHLTNADDCVRGIKGMSEMVTDIVIHKVFADGPRCAHVVRPPCRRGRHAPHGQLESR